MANLLQRPRQGEAKMKKSKLIEELEEAGIIDKNLSIGAKHSKLKGLLNSPADVENLANNTVASIFLFSFMSKFLSLNLF